MENTSYNMSKIRNNYNANHAKYRTIISLYFKDRAIQITSTQKNKICLPFIMPQAFIFF